MGGIRAVFFCSAPFLQKITPTVGSRYFRAIICEIYPQQEIAKMQTALAPTEPHPIRFTLTTVYPIDEEF